MLCQLNLLSTKRGEGNVGDFMRCLEQRAEGQRVQRDEDDGWRDDPGRSELNPPSCAFVSCWMV